MVKLLNFTFRGSGTYFVSNIDLVSQEIYFTKCNSISGLEPTIYYSPQTHCPEANEAINSTLSNIVENLAEKSRIPVNLEVTPRTPDSPLRISNSQFRKISKSLLFIADITPISSLPGAEQSRLLVDPNVCVELGYGIQTKDNGQILLLNMERPKMQGLMPFDMVGYKHLSFTDERKLSKSLPKLLESLLQRYNLF